MLRKSVLVVAVFVMLFSSNLYAQSFSLGLKAGTLGVGAEVEGDINNMFGARIGGNYLKYNYSGNCGDCEMDTDFEIKSTTIPVLLDWHPSKGSFRISGGVVFSNSKMNASTTPSGDSLNEIGDGHYTNEEVGTYEIDVKFKKTNPYLGLGWDTSFGKSKRFGFLCDLGIIFQGKPEVEVSANGDLKDDETFKRDLAEDEETVQDSLNKWRYYPLVAMGVSYRF